MLVPGVGWDGKEAALAPLEGLLLAPVVGPDGRAAAALQDVDRLFVDVAPGLGLALGRHFQYVGVVEPAGAIKVDEDPRDVAPGLPRLQRQVEDVRDVETADGVQPLS